MLPLLHTCFLIFLSRIDTILIPLVAPSVTGSDQLGVVLIIFTSRFAVIDTMGSFEN